jgi:hypothetical protein
MLRETEGKYDQKMTLRLFPGTGNVWKLSYEDVEIRCIAGLWQRGFCRDSGSPLKWPEY